MAPPAHGDLRRDEALDDGVPVPLPLRRLRLRSRLRRGPARDHRPAPVPVRAGRARRRAPTRVALFVFALAAPLAITVHSHPFGLSSYVPLVGGTAGGADLGLNRQFWGFTTQSLAPYLEANAPRNASVYYHDTISDAWSRMIDEKRLRPDLRGAGSMSDADFAIVHLERHMLEVEYNEWSVFGTDVPDYVLTHDGVPIIDVFRRKR